MQEDNNSAEHTFRFKRLTKLFWALELTTVAVLVAELIAGDILASIVIALQGLLLGSVYYLTKQGHFNRATTVLFTILTLTVSILMWSYGGLNDETLLAFPVFFLFSAILGNKKLFFSLLGYAVATVLAIGLANETGWHVNKAPDGGLHSAILVIILLLVIGYSISLLSNDLSKVLAQLSEENKRVKDSQSKIQQLVYHDALTNLPNRLLAKERFEHALTVGKREPGLLCLMYLDLDNFKAVNDSLGHSSGDTLLQEIAVRLQALTRESDTVCRQGGDEFLIIFESIKTEKDIPTIAEKVLDTLKQPITINDSSIVSTVSMGIAVTARGGTDFETICKEADMAMYHAKELGRNGYCFYDQAMDQRARENQVLQAEISLAISEQQFELYFQPKIDLKSGATIGAEALIRWNHPARGLVLPMEFIPLAEHSGAIVDISKWVVTESCRECKRWHDLGHTQLVIAVNISPVDFQRGQMMSIVEQALKESGLPPSALELELTESLLMNDSTETNETVQQLRNIGVELTIDDFGTGYSNLAYLKKFDVSVLKIDQSFVRTILTNTDDKAIVQAIIQMATSLSLKTVAEGVESPEVAEMLATMGCDMGQGYSWSRPLTADAFLDYLP